MASTSSAIEQQGVEFDLGNLLTTDPRPIHTDAANKGNLEAVIQSEMLALTKAFFKQVWTLPLERVEDTVVAVLPKPSTRLPREKPVPKPKAPTKWERFAREKGIQKVKKSKMVWDQASRQWLPRFGYGKIQTPEDDWAHVVPDHEDGMEDPFAQRKKEKKERVAKTELQRLKNIAKAHKTKIPAGGVLPDADSHKPSKNQVGQAAAFARVSTASAGKFDQKLPKEKPPKVQGVKRKFEDNLTTGKSEKERLLGILKEVTSKKPRTEASESSGQLGRINRRSMKKGKPEPRREQEEKDDRRQSTGRNKNDKRRGAAKSKQSNTKQRRKQL